jgi:quercetin dioxygenase-like cupin family protein
VRASGREPLTDGPVGAGLYVLVSEACGATRFSTGIAIVEPGACVPYHSHPFSESITVIEGTMRFFVEGRAYTLGPQDCAHVPSGIPHMARNEDRRAKFVAHWTFSTAAPSREPIGRVFPLVERGLANPGASDPEKIVRFSEGAVYELSSDAFFIDLFARRLGSSGVCGGHGRFLPGASLPCHVHDFDESITIVKGSAVCLVEGKRYELSDCDTAFIPRGIPHRFLNLSDSEMAMMWVYAGDEPDRRIVDAGYCSGETAWPGA